MNIEGEAAGDVLTGAVVARAVEGRKTGEDAAHGHGKCLNCGAQLSGAYCSACGQAAHLHRTLSSIGHDILHGVFHFEGKVWKTLPELFFHPGRLTRRYIDGERAKFVSPMALYLFTVFLMFAVFGMIGSRLYQHEEGDTSAVTGQTTQTKESLAEAIEDLDAEIAEMQARLAESGLSDEDREDLEADLKSTQTTREGLLAVASGDWNKLIGRDDKVETATVEPEPPESAAPETDGKSGQFVSGDFKVNTGFNTFDERLTAGIKKINENPQLLLYKLKTNGYKFSWALIPLSLPFMWLLFFWRRDVHLYDHAIFITYSITFMMLMAVIISILKAVHVSSGLLNFAVFLIPVHMYKQLRGTYSLSRAGAFARLCVLQIFCCLVLVIFTLALVAIGVMG